MSVFYEPGRYWGKILGQGFNEASTGTKQFVLTFVVKGRVDPADPEGDLLPVQAEYERSVFMALTDKTVDFVLDNLIKLGFTGSSFSELNPDNPSHFTFAGTETAFSCEHNTWQGTTRERWSVASEGVGFKNLDEKGYKELDNLFGKHLKAKSKAAKGTSVTPAPSPPAPETVPPSVDDDEIPF